MAAARSLGLGLSWIQYFKLHDVGNLNWVLQDEPTGVKNDCGRYFVLNQVPI